MSTLNQHSKLKPAAHLLDVLKFECSLVDGRVRNIIAFGVLEQQSQIGVDVLNTLVLVVLHLVPVGNLSALTFGKKRH